MNRKIYNTTNNLLDSLFDDTDEGICSKYINTYKNQIEPLPNDYAFDFSEFKGTIDNILEKYQEKNIDYDVITIDTLTEPKLIKKELYPTTITTYKSPLIINFIGEPGAGKSWAAWYISAKLKQLGYKVEYLPEFAKSKLYEKSEKVFSCEPYIFGKQLYKMLSISDEVDIIVTDSPIILPHFYEKDIVAKELLKQLELYYFNQMNNLNVYLIRDHEYKTEGRFQTEQQAEVIHELILDFLIEYHIDYTSYHTSKIESDEFLQYIKKHIEKGE